MRKHLSDPVKGHLSYTNHATDGKVISLEIADLEIAANKASFSGLCKQQVSECTTFKVDVTDNGQPNATPRDTFEIVRDPLGLGIGTGGADGGTLGGGNIKVSVTTASPNNTR
jgi:hypothetical protein